MKALSSLFTEQMFQSRQTCQFKRPNQKYETGEHKMGTAKPDQQLKLKNIMKNWKSDPIIYGITKAELYMKDEDLNNQW